MDNIEDEMRRHADAWIRERWATAEDQVRIFLKMGYRLDELTILLRDDGPLEVLPNSPQDKPKP